MVDDKGNISSRKHFEGDDFRDFNLSGIDLSGCVFDECIFTGARFHIDSLRRVRISGGLLIGARFKWCNIEEMTINGYDVETIAFESPYADEILLTPDNCPELRAALDEANRRPKAAEMDPAESPFADRLGDFASRGRGAVFRRCIFQRAMFRGTGLDDASFSNCNLMGVYFHLCDFTGAEVSRCDVSGVSFNNIGLGLVIPKLG